MKKMCVVGSKRVTVNGQRQEKSQGLQGQGQREKELDDDEVVKLRSVVVV